MAAYPTLLDIAKLNGTDAEVGLIEEVIKMAPEVRMGAARTIKGIHYKTRVRTALPTVGFRAANQGTPISKSTFENRLYEAYILNPTWLCDKAVADECEDGAQYYIATESIGIMESALYTLSVQFYYGTGGLGDAKGFPGISQAIDPSMIVDAQGTTASTASSVYAVRFGIQQVCWLWGLNGEFALQPVKEVVLNDSLGNPLTYYHEELLARPGLQVGSKWSVGQIKNITQDTGKGLTDKLMGQLYELYPDAIRPDCFFMTRRSREQLRASRTAVNPTGREAPTPQDFEGIPIYGTDGILNTEAIS